MLRSRADLALENLALRQQLAVLQRSVRKPHLCQRDRIFWVVFSQIWRNWQGCLALVQPETVIAWHRQGVRLFWRWKSRHGKPGRPKVEREVRELIRRMSQENPTWGAPRV